LTLTKVSHNTKEKNIVYIYIYIYIYIYNYLSAVKLQTLCGQVEDIPVIILNQISCYD
jgi:hypothetical protein